MKSFSLYRTMLNASHRFLTLVSSCFQHTMSEHNCFESLSSVRGSFLVKFFDFTLSRWPSTVCCLKNLTCFKKRVSNKLIFTACRLYKSHHANRSFGSSRRWKATNTTVVSILLFGNCLRLFWFFAVFLRSWTIGRRCYIRRIVCSYQRRVRLNVRLVTLTRLFLFISTWIILW